MLFAAIGILFSSCKKNFPSDLDAFSLDMNFTQTEFKPVLGKTTQYQDIFNAGESTLPLSFRISAVRTFDGKEAPELLKLFPVSIWKQPYTGGEKTLAEIQAKRDTVMRPLWEIGQHSGNLTMHAAASSIVLKSYPDSGYYFDVEVSSNGGRRFFKDMHLTPLKEQAYEPYVESGYLYPNTVINVVGDSTRTLVVPRIWFYKKGEGSSLSFKFLGPDLQPIKLSKFNNTDWDNLIHGFNKTFAADSTAVRYDVAYPIPLVPTLKTKWTSAGRASTAFTYTRIAAGGLRDIGAILFNFSIYEKGDWEIIFFFPDEKPLFDND